MRIRIFLSSPSDVRSERLIAERLIRRLDAEFAYHFHVEPVLWEREPLVASEHFQTSVTPPRETDIVVVILWSRLGVPLPIEKFRGPISGLEVTGTEWEFEDALSSYRERGLPDLLFYRKTASITASLDDAEAVQQQLRQKQLVDEFVRRWFIGSGATTFTAAFRDFGDAAQFEEMLDTHLRELLLRRLVNQEGERTRGTIRWHEGSPYRGLQTFELQHAPIFFGRIRERNELRELLSRRADAGCAFVLVLGASGSGKSSLVRCGLLSDLKLPGMIGRVALCRHAVFRPSDAKEDLIAGVAAAILGPTALPELAEQHYDVARVASLLREAPEHARPPIEAALARAASREQLSEVAETRLLIIVDQLEELFSIDPKDNQARSAFASALYALARSGQVWVIATMRSDFFHRIAEVPTLVQMSDGEGRYLLGFPDLAALRQIIQQPTIEAGLRFETDETRGLTLAQDVEKDAAESAGALPLLEFALDELWRNRTEHGELTFAAYRQIGGLKGAIGLRAEQEFLKQPQEVQSALPTLLRALATSAPGDEVTARPTVLAQFPPGTSGRSLIDALLSPSARLLVADGDGEGARIRVAHEALLTHWERARKQLSTEQADLQTRARLEQASARWHADRTANRSSLLLNPGAPLVEAEDLFRRVPDLLDPTIVSFINASSAATRRSRRRLQAAAASFAIIAVLAGISAWQAYRAAAAARSRELAAEAEQQVEANPELAVLLGAAALDARDTRRAESALRDALLHVPMLALTGHSDRVRGITFGPDGRWLVTASRDGDARVFETGTGSQIRVLSAHTGPVHDVVFTADGRNVLTAGEDGVIRVWDVASGLPVRELVGHEGPVYTLARAPQGHIIASAGKDGTVRLWNPSSDKPEKTIATWQGDEERAINRVAFSPDGTRVIAARESFDATVWNITDGQLVLRLPHKAYVVSASFSPDGRSIATASHELVHIWGTNGKESLSPLRCAGLCGFIEFDGSGEYLAVGSQSGRTDIYRIRTMTIERQLIGQGFVRTVAFSHDGTIATGGDDAVVRIWTTHSPVQTFPEHPSEVANAAFGADGRLVITSSGTQVFVWDALTGKRLNAFSADTGEVISALFSPDNRLIVTAGESGSASEWTSDGNSIRNLPGHTTQVNSATFSADSKQIVTSSKDGHVRLFTAATGALVRDLPPEGGEALAAVFSPDGRFVAAGYADGTVRVWSTAGREPARLIRSNNSPVYAVAFSRDGKSMLTASQNGAVRLSDVASGSPSSEYKLADEVVSVDFSSDGRFFVAGGGHTVSIVEAATGHVVQTVGSDSGIRGVAFRPDGRAIIMANADHAAKIFACEACLSGPELKKVAKQRVTRGFSTGERARYLDEDWKSLLWFRDLNR